MTTPRAFDGGLNARGRVQNVATPTAATDAANKAYVDSLPQRVVVVTDAATPTLNAAVADEFRWTLGANRTIPAPTGGTDGQRILLVLSVGTTSFTPTFGSGYGFGTDITAAITNAAIPASTSREYALHLRGSAWNVIGMVSGYSP